MSEMNVIEIKEPGGPAVLHYTKRPIPSPGAGEVLIKVSAAGVNRPDILQRMGFYPPPEGASDLPGLEVAGEIIETGMDVPVNQKGQKVCALIAGGGYAEYAVADAKLCLPVPDDMELTAAAALPETFFTVWTNVFEDGALKAGERLLVHGGASGIGTAAIAMARAFGADIVATAGNDEKCQALMQLGATDALNYNEQDWEHLINESGGIDVVLDMVGGEYVAKNLNCLRPRGRHISIAFLSGMVAEINIMKIMRNRLTLTGSTLRTRSAEEKARIAAALKKNVWPMLNNRKVAPVIDSIFPLCEAPEAHRRMEQSSHIGKIVLRVDG